MLDDEAVGAVVRREGAAAAGRPERKVQKVTPVLPQMMMADFDDGTQATLLVLDGHVVVGKSMATVARYLELLHFPAKHALDRDQLIAVLTKWGEVPRGLQPLSQLVPGPQGEEAALIFDGEGALLTVYGRLRAATMPAQPSGIGRGHGGGSGGGGGHPGEAPFLRIELRIDHERHFKWRTERWDGEKWQPQPLP